MKLPALREIIEERKGIAIEKLSDSYAKNRLPLEEYERLVEYINKIESERELVVVEKIVREYAREYAAEYDGDDAPKEPARDDDDNEPDNYPHHGSYNYSNSNLALLSSRTIAGPVKSGTQFLSFLGSQHIKLRKADLEKRKTVLNIVSILGETVIHVESGIRVSNKVIPILGGAWTDGKVTKQARDGEALLVVSGTALLGNVTVKLLKE